MSTFRGLLGGGVFWSPEYTTSASVPAGDAFDNAGVGTRHRLCSRDPVECLERRPRAQETDNTCLCQTTSPRTHPCTQKCQVNGPDHLPEWGVSNYAFAGTSVDIR